MVIQFCGILSFHRGDQARAGERRIKCDVSLGEPVAARLDKTVLFHGSLGEETEPLEDRAVPKPISVGQDLAVVTLGVEKVDSKTVGNMLDATAQFGIVENVNNRPVKIGNRDPASSPPEGPDTEYFPRIDVLQLEWRAVSDLRLRADGLCSEDNDVTKDLFGKVPMLSSSTAADVRRGIKSRNQNPGIVKNMNAFQRIERNGDVDPVPHSA